MAEITQARIDQVTADLAWYARETDNSDPVGFLAGYYGVTDTVARRLIIAAAQNLTTKDLRHRRRHDARRGKHRA